ncbi:hypothetical protein, partial [Klebsiella pneumoniae]|uniref:hypothetical protein n=1 Tax=Klebsiella pneumoniae TaxID=573 RepID=UPI003969CC61
SERFHEVAARDIDIRMNTSITALSQEGEIVTATLDDGTENTPSAADGDAASPEAGTPEVPQDQRVVPSPTADSDSDCRREDNAAATPTAKAD